MIITYKVAPNKLTKKQKTQSFCAQKDSPKKEPNQAGVFQVALQSPAQMSAPVWGFLISQAELIGLSSEPSRTAQWVVELFIRVSLSDDSRPSQHLASCSATFSLRASKKMQIWKAFLVIELAAANTEGLIHGARHLL